MLVRESFLGPTFMGILSHESGTRPSRLTDARVSWSQEGISAWMGASGLHRTTDTWCLVGRTQSHQRGSRRQEGFFPILVYGLMTDRAGRPVASIPAGVAVQLDASNTGDPATPNIFGHIITDLGAMIQGGMGIAAGGNINPHGTSMFEPIGGSAPKYTGKNEINPLAAICAMAMMLDALADKTGDESLRRAAQRVDNAVRETTPELETLSAGRMGYSTTQVGDLVVDAL